MSEGNPHAPFKNLGSRLKTFRAQNKESLAEAAGAVEIDESELQRIEQGKKRPSEEVLMLLISHFGIQEDEAVSLWEMAGYDNSDDETETNNNPQNTLIMVMANDPRVIYSDSVHVAANKAGVVLNFQQGTPPLNPMVVSRIGMSYEQTAVVHEILGEILKNAKYQSQPKFLPPGDK